MSEPQNLDDAPELVDDDPELFIGEDAEDDDPEEHA